MNGHAQVASAPIVFPYTTSEIRAFVIDGVPWFVANDICAVLGLSHLASNLCCLEDGEKKMHTMHTPVGPQQMAIINESGLYSLIFASRKSEAKRFAKWMTSEVLPALRKTGRCVHQPSQPQSTPLGEIAQWVVGEYTRSMGRYLSYSNQQISPRLHAHIRARFGVNNVRDISANRLGDLLALLEDFYGKVYRLWWVRLELETALLQTLHALVGEDRYELPPAIRQAMAAVAVPETDEDNTPVTIRNKAFHRLNALASHLQ